MAKNEKVRTDDFSLDGELDFGSFDYDKIDGQLSSDAKNSKSRSPVAEVFKGTISGAVDKFKSPSFLARVTRNALPEEFGTIVDTADTAAGTASALYDDAVKELKPQASRLAKKVDRLVPEERKTLKKITSRIARLFGDEADLSGLSKQQLQDQGIATSLASIFEQQQAVQNEVTAQESAKDEIKENIRRKEFNSSIGILTQISNTVGRMSSYQERVTQAVQKKSLELQYRSYFALTEIATTNKQYYEVFKAQNEAIAKNTALPEFVKIKASERFKDLARTKFMDKVQNTFFGEGSAIDRGLKRLAGDVREYMKGVKQGLEAASLGIDGLAQLQDTNKMLADFGGEQISGAQLAGSALGGFLGDKVGDKAASFLRPKLDKIPFIRKGVVRGANAALNLPGTINEIRKSDKAQELLRSDGLKGAVARGVDRVADYFTDREPDKRINNPNGLGNLQDPAILNNRIQRSVNDIIPGYLARILREITIMRTGDENSPMVYFDHQSGKFVDRKAIGEAVKKALSEKVRSSSYGFFAKNAASNLSEGEDVTDQQKDQLAEFIAKISAIPNLAFTPENVKNTNAYRALSGETKKLVDMLLEKKITQAEDPDRGQLSFTKNVMEVRGATPDARGLIESLIQAGYGEMLESEGLVSRDRNGDYIIDEEAYLKFVREQGLITSDRNKKTKVTKAGAAKRRRGPSTNKKLPKQLIKSDEETKEDIHPLNPKRALNAIRKTGIFDWFYKPGEGDSEQHRGPMAQDVRKNMGDGAAPGGKKIDLTSMNGNNMAAIQELADQQDGLLGKIKNLFKSKDEDKASAMKVVKGIATDVKALRKLVETGKGGFGGGGRTRRPTGKQFNGEDTYRDHLGNIWTASGQLVSRAAKDVKAGAERAYAYGKDKAGQGYNAAKAFYDRNRDPVLEAFKKAKNKGQEYATLGYQKAKDFIKNDLPVGVRKAKELFDDAKSAVKNSLFAVRDVYVQGMKRPVLRAALLNAGEYFDSATGKVLRTMDDVVKAKGDIVDSTGALVLSFEDAAKGLYDQYGTKLKSGLQRLAERATDMGKKAVERVKAFWSVILDQGKEFGGKLVSEWLPKIKGFFQNFGMFGTQRIYDVLVEIRGVLRGENPPRHEDLKPTKPNEKPKKQPVKKAAAKKADKPETFVDKVKNRTQGLVDSAKQRGQGILDKLPGDLGEKAKAKTSSLFDKAAGYFAQDKGLDVNTTGKKTLVGRRLAEMRAAAKQAEADEKLEKKTLVGKKLAAKRAAARKAAEALGSDKKTLVGRKLAARRMAQQQMDEENESPELEKPEAKYLSDDPLGNVFGAAKSLKDKLMARFGKKEEEVVPEPTKGKRRRKAKAPPEPEKTGLAKVVDNTKKRGQKALGAIKGGKGITGKLLAGAASLFGGSAEEPDPKDKRGRKKAEPEATAKKAAAPKRRRRGGKVDPTYNDRDGSGRRDGSWEDRLEDQAAADAERRAKAPGLEKAEAKYVSEKDIFSSLMDKVSGVFSFLTGNAGKLFGAAGSVLSGIGSIAGSIPGVLGGILGGAKGLFGAGRAAAGVAGSALGTIGRPIAGALGALGRIGPVANIVSKVGLIRNVALVGSLMTGGVGSAILGAVGTGISAIGAVLASPVALGIAAVAAAGYGAYKLYKYVTRDDVDDTELVRMYQYGLPVEQKTHRHEFLALEQYLLDGRVGFNDGKAVLLDKKIDPEELLNIFSIDKGDAESANKLAQWFSNRFKPFFLTNCTALFSVNKKVSLKDAHKQLTAAEKVKFYNLISFDSGPYSVTVSPFKDVPELANTKTQALELIKMLAANAKVEADSQAKADAAKAEKDAKAKKEKADKAAKAVAGVTALSQGIDPAKKAAADTAAQAAAQAKETAKMAEANRDKVADIVKSNEDRNKAGPKDESQAAEDGPLREKPATGDKGAVDTTINEGGKAASSGPLKVADGPIRDGSQAMQYLKLGDGVKLDGMNPAMKQQLLAMIQEYGERTGKSVTVTSGARSPEEQEKLWRQNPKKAAKPGSSLHEYGLAADLNSGDLDALEELGLMRKYGFTRPVGGEPWHTEAAGIQTNIKLAKNDPSFASQAIGASINKGGGGVGSIRGTPLGKRDTMFAVGQMGLEAKTVKGDESDKDKVAALKGGPDVTGAQEPAQAPKPVAAVTVSKPTPVQTAANDSTPKAAIKVAAVNTQSDKYNKAADMPDMEAEAKAKSAIAATQVDTSGPNGDVKSQIADTAKKRNTDPNDILTFAAMESSLDPRAQSGNARGLYGFMPAAWSEQVAKPGTGLRPTSSPFDVNDSTVAASEYYKSNKRMIQGYKPDANLTDVYLAHFLGPSGARKFLSADPSDIAANVLPNAAANNRVYFYEGTRPRTVAEVYRFISQKLAKKAKEFGINYSGETTLATKPQSPRTSGEAPPVQTADAGGGSPSAVIPRPTRDAQPLPIRQPIPSAQGRVAPVVPTTAVQPDNVSRPQEMGASSQAMVSVNDTLTKQLGVQTQMLSVLQQIMANTMVSNKPAEQPRETQAQVPGKRPDFQRIESAVDLTRKSA